MGLALTKDEKEGLVLRLETLSDLYLLYTRGSIDSLGPVILMISLDIYDSILTKYYNLLKDCIKNKQVDKIHSKSNIPGDIIKKFLNPDERKRIIKTYSEIIRKIDSGKYADLSYFEYLFLNYSGVSNIPQKSALKECILETEKNYPEIVLESFNKLNSWWNERNEYTHRLSVHRVPRSVKIDEIVSHTITFSGYVLSPDFFINPHSSGDTPLREIRGVNKNVSFEVGFIRLITRSRGDYILGQLYREMANYLNSQNNLVEFIDNIKRGDYIAILTKELKKAILSPVRAKLVELGYTKKRVNSMYSEDSNRVEVEFDDTNFGMLVKLDFPDRYSHKKIERIKEYLLSYILPKIRKETWLNMNLVYST